MTPENFLLILLGPFLVVGLVVAIASAMWPGLIEVLFPAPRPRPRPVARPRPARWAVA
ncbi:hypothetical protein ACQPZX_41305 [Actinoplanes sp. CA-142083]|uniref:hypothetical protein n=1 Tax=Actinoplanes sp. CA-142083 TaxID=3239903 RepID=UPI003D8CD866